jgi:hypothetical protein
VDLLVYTDVSEEHTASNFKGLSLRMGIPDWNLDSRKADYEKVLFSVLCSFLEDD